MRVPAPASADVDLLSCDREPIHLLGTVQPIGFLLSVTGDWTVVRASKNVDAFLGISCDEIIGKPIAAAIDPEVLHDVRGLLQMSAGIGIVERLYGRPLSEGGAPFDIAVHQSGREFVLELEPSRGETGASLARLRAIDCTR